MVALTLSSDVNCAPIAKISKPSKKSSRSSGFPSNMFGASFHPTTGTHLHCNRYRLLSRAHCALSSGRAVFGVLDDRGGRSSSGIGKFRSLEVDKGVGVVGDSKARVDGCESGDRDEGNEL